MWTRSVLWLWMKRKVFRMKPTTSDDIFRTLDVQLATRRHYLEQELATSQKSGYWWGTIPMLVAIVALLVGYISCMAGLI